MSYAEHARRFLANRQRRTETSNALHEISEKDEERVAPLPIEPPDDPVVAGMAAAILAFTPEELADYRAELADFPVDDPPSDRERAALALAEVTLALRTKGRAA